MTTRLYAEPAFLGHEPGPGHPERPARLAAILEQLDRAPITGVERRAPRRATRAEVLRVHAAAHVDQVTSLAGRAARLDEDTAMSPGSADAAWLAAGAAAELAQGLLAGDFETGFALVRPPGHHAEASHAMGFCLFNNVAVAAEAALAAGARRVLVLDWDVHHGNGTQHHFEARRDVLFLSSHQHPFYPGTGAATEVGRGEGRGFTVNAALPPGLGDADYGAVFHELFLPVAEAYRPDLVLVSAGFDPHEADPLGQMRVTERGFAAMCSALKALADETCGGRLGLVLEGGYDLGGLARSVHACVEVLAGARRDEFPSGAGRPATEAITASRHALAGLAPGLEAGAPSRG